MYNYVHGDVLVVIKKIIVTTFFHSTEEQLLINDEILDLTDSEPSCDDPPQNIDTTDGMFLYNITNNGIAFRIIIFTLFTVEVWEDDLQSFDDFSAFSENSTDVDTTCTTSISLHTKLILWLVLFLLMLRSYHFVPDVVISLVAKFLRKYFAILAFHSHSDFIKEMAAKMPSSMNQLEQFVKYKRNSFVVCPTCMQLFKPEECIDVVGTNSKSKP